MPIFAIANLRGGISRRRAAAGWRALVLVAALVFPKGAEAQAPPNPSAPTDRPVLFDDLFYSGPLVYSGPFSTEGSLSNPWTIPVTFGGATFYPPVSSNLSPLPSRDYSPPQTGWTLAPSLLAGPVYDDNLLQSSRPRRGVGARIAPSVVAEWNVGIHRLAVYGNEDGRFYPSAGFGDVYTASVGGVYEWRPTPDLIFLAQGGAQKGVDAFSAGVPIGPTGALSSTTQRSYSQIQGSVSVQKYFDQFFVILGERATRTVYSQPNARSLNTAQISQNGDTFATNGRLGYHLTPLIYGYLEGTYDMQVYDSPLNNSRGYRATSGLGTDRISLFQGEIYGGYQIEKYPNLATQAQAPLYGGSLRYFPTPLLTLGASIDRTVTKTLPTIFNPAGLTTAISTASLAADYAVTASLTAAVRIDYSLIGSAGSNNQLGRYFFAKGVLSYNLYRNVDLSLEYQYTNLASNALNSYKRNLVTLGMLYKY